MKKTRGQKSRATVPLKGQNIAAVRQGTDMNLLLKGSYVTAGDVLNPFLPPT
jgi:hypothetical protein